MPHFIKKLTNLQSIGPILDVTVFPPIHLINSIDKSKQTTPQKSCVGLIDTGASISAINSAIVQELNLIARDYIPVLTPAGISNHFTYDIGIMLPEEMGYRMYFVEATGSDLSKQPYDVLIGRDVLQYCTLIFNGWDNSFQLHV